MGGEQSTCTIVVYLIILFAAARDFSSTVYELLIFIFFFSFLHLSYGIFLSSCFFFCSHLLLFYLFLKIFFPFVTFFFFFFPGLGEMTVTSRFLETKKICYERNGTDQ